MKDRAVNTILNFGIGVLYPILIYFAVNTFFPDGTTTNTVRGYYRDRTVTTIDDYAVLLKVGIALIVSVLTLMVVINALRELKEVARGLVGGAALSVFVAAIWISTIDGTQTVRVVGSFALIGCAALLIGLLYWSEQNLKPWFDTKPAQPKTPRTKSPKT
jgi:hypothetical protein